MASCTRVMNDGIPAKKTLKIYHFDSIDSNVPFPIVIDSHQARDHFEIIGDNAMVRKVNVVVKNNVIHLSMERGYSYPRNLDLKIHIGLRELTSLSVKGIGSVTANHLKSRYLTVNDLTNGSVILNGNNLGLKKVDHKSNGFLKITGVNTKHLNVNVRGNGDTIIQGNSIGLDNLIHNGRGNVEMKYVNSNCLSLDTQGGGNIRLIGSMGLSHLKYQGTGNIYLSKVDSNHLDMDLNGSGSVKLIGTVNLNKVTLKGNSDIDMVGVKADDIQINSYDQGKIHLTGTTTILGANLFDSAYLDARRLHAKKAYIDTSDQSRAEVWVSKELNAIAAGYSNIYYYDIPKFQANFMRKGGAILPMHWV